MKSNFSKDKTNNDKINPRCKVCRKKAFNLNQNRLFIYQKKLIEQNGRKRNLNLKNGIKVDAKCRLSVNTRIRFYNSIKRKKSSTAKDIIRIDFDAYRKWIEYQLTPEMNWSSIQIDHVIPISTFDTSKDEGLKEAFIWINTQ